MPVVVEPPPRRTKSDPSDTPVSDFREELIIKEARRRRNRRRLRIGAVVFFVAVVVALVVALVTQVGGHNPQPRKSVGREVRSATLRTISGVQPEYPGALAVGGNGDLYVADPARNQILERLSDGHFEILVGTGQKGFSGDGGTATGAEINDPAGMAVAPNGTLYFSDLGNGRIRAVSPQGTITTIAGNGRTGWVADGTPALSASLRPTAVAFSPSHQLYVAVQDGGDQGEVLRLNTNSTFTRVLGTSATAFPNPLSGSVATRTPAFDPLGLAFDSARDLYVVGNTDGTLLRISPQGLVTYPAGKVGALTPWGDSGLVAAPDGSVLGMDQRSVLRLTAHRARTFRSFPPSFLNLNGFTPGGIAVAPNGTVYLDSDRGRGFSWPSSVVELAPNGNAALLWRGPNPAP